MSTITKNGTNVVITVSIGEIHWCFGLLLADTVQENPCFLTACRPAWHGLLVPETWSGGLQAVFPRLLLFGKSTSCVCTLDSGRVEACRLLMTRVQMLQIRIPHLVELLGMGTDSHSIIPSLFHYYIPSRSMEMLGSSVLGTSPVWLAQLYALATSKSGITSWLVSFLLDQVPGGVTRV